MRAVVLTPGDSGVRARLADRPVPEPGPGEVRVRVRVSGVNPIDWKTTTRADATTPEWVPDHDGAGVIDAVGDGVADRVGQRVWLWGAGYRRTEGTAQEYVVLPDHLARPLPDAASFDLGASVGIPALTAHRCLTLHEAGPARLAPDALAGRTVLVTGGAGAVGNAAIQLARWAGATIVTTVSGDRKAALAKAAGADHVVNYRDEDVVAAVRAVAPDGVDVIVEVAGAANASTDVAVLARHGVVACYAGVAEDRLVLPIRGLIDANAVWHGVFLYSIPEPAAEHGVAAVQAAIEAGAFRVGEEAGLPLVRFPLAELAEAHAALRGGDVVGKVLVDVAPSSNNS